MREVKFRSSLQVRKLTVLAENMSVQEMENAEPVPGDGHLTATIPTELGAVRMLKFQHPNTGKNFEVIGLHL